MEEKENSLVFCKKSINFNMSFSFVIFPDEDLEVSRSETIVGVNKTVSI